MAIVWLKFIVCTVLILFAGKRVAKYGDAIAEKTGLGGLWIGVILVSVATSLPELFAGIGSTVFVDAPNLMVGNLFGANTYNLINIAVLDFIHKGPPLLSLVSTGQLLSAGLSLIPVTIAALGIFLSRQFSQLAFANISLYSILILISYFICARVIFGFEQRQQQIIKKLRHKEGKILFKYDAVSLKTVCMRYIIAAFVIAGTGIWLAYIGDDLARHLRLDHNFIGSLFLGFATTLPEMTVSIAAIRLGAKELAVANMLGSNLFNITIIAINDVLYRKAPIFNVLSQQHFTTVFLVVFMTVIVIAGLALKPKRKTRFGISNYAAALVIAFVAGAYINFCVGK